MAQPSQFQTTAATSRTSSSSVSHRADPDYTVDVGGESTDSLLQSHDLHRSYSRPLSRDTMSTSPTRPVERAPSRSSLDPRHHSQTRPPHPNGRSDSDTISEPTLHPRTSTRNGICLESIRFYQRTATDLSVAIPRRLRRATYRELYDYYAYELPFILAWGQTQAGNDYFMKVNRNPPRR